MNCTSGVMSFSMASSNFMMANILPCMSMHVSEEKERRHQEINPHENKQKPIMYHALSLVGML